jgi:hypothetical protein
VVLKSFLKLIGSGLVTIILVSSAKRNVLDFTIYKYIILNLNKSLIQSKKSDGPSIEPCGRARFTTPQLEDVLQPTCLSYIITLWYLPSR